MLVKLIKVKSEKMFKGKDGKEHNYINYYVVADNGVRVPIQPNLKIDGAKAKLDLLADYVKD